MSVSDGRNNLFESGESEYDAGQYIFSAREMLRTVLDKQWLAHPGFSPAKWDNEVRDQLAESSRSFSEPRLPYYLVDL
jgi:hypothetical protein